MPKAILRPLRGEDFLLAENVANGLGQYKFGPTYRYHLSLVTKNIIKVYKQAVGVLVILFVFCKFICVYNAFVFFFGILWKESVVFSFCPKNLFRTKCLTILTVLDKILSFFCVDVVAMRKILSIGV